MSTPKDFAETLVDELIDCVRKFEQGRASNDSVMLHKKNMVQALHTPPPHSEDFPGTRELLYIAILPTLTPHLSFETACNSAWERAGKALQATKGAI